MGRWYANKKYIAGETDAECEQGEKKKNEGEVGKEGCSIAFRDEVEVRHNRTEEKGGGGAQKG